MIDHNGGKRSPKMQTNFIIIFIKYIFVQANSDFVWTTLYFYTHTLYTQENRYEFVWYANNNRMIYIYIM